jgi:hypothetical protein
MGSLRDLIVLVGPGLEPWRCRSFDWEDGTIAGIDRIEPVLAIEKGTWW